MKPQPLIHQGSPLAWRMASVQKENLALMLRLRQEFNHAKPRTANRKRLRWAIGRLEDAQGLIAEIQIELS